MALGTHLRSVIQATPKITNKKPTQISATWVSSKVMGSLSVSAGLHGVSNNNNQDPDNVGPEPGALGIHNPAEQGWRKNICDQQQQDDQALIVHGSRSSAGHRVATTGATRLKPCIRDEHQCCTAQLNISAAFAHPSSSGGF